MSDIIKAKPEVRKNNNNAKKLPITLQKYYLKKILTLMDEIEYVDSVGMANSEVDPTVNDDRDDHTEKPCQLYMKL